MGDFLTVHAFPDVLGLFDEAVLDQTVSRALEVDERDMTYVS